MENVPRFIKEFSKEHSKDERGAIAKEIRAMRAEHFAEKRTQEERESTTGDRGFEMDPAAAELIERAEEAGDKLEKINDSGVELITEYLRTQKVRQDLAPQVDEEVQATEKPQDVQGPAHHQKAKEMLKFFYEDQKKKWETTPYSKEEMEQYFSEEHLASLSLDDYALLMRRFPNEMVTHVTRQGIRDHSGHPFHRAGEGAYRDGFMRILQDGKLRSALSIKLMQGEKNDVVKKFLNLDEMTDKKDTLRALDNLTDPKDQSTYASYGDSASVHVAVEQVANLYYGSERLNEVFVAYPSAHIASQYHFAGNLTGGARDMRNDAWVYLKEEEGMNINAGIVFVPKEAQVDPKTGSRYEIDEQKNPVINTEAVGAYRSLIDHPAFGSFAEEAIAVLEKKQTNPEKVADLKKRLQDEFGIIDPALQSAALDYAYLVDIRLKKKNEKKASAEEKKRYADEVDKSVGEVLQKHEVLYKKAQNTVSSEEFWESYFTQHPERRPSKLVYYKGGDPTKALVEWRQSVGLSVTASETEQRHLGFEEHEVGDKTEFPHQEQLNRFRSLGRELIIEHFKGKPVPKLITLPGGGQDFNPEWIEQQTALGLWPPKDQSKTPPPLPKMPPPLPQEAPKVSAVETSIRGNFCGQCGARLSEAGNFCGECGAKI